MTFCIDAGTPETKRETLKTSGVYAERQHCINAETKRKRFRINVRLH